MGRHWRHATISMGGAQGQLLVDSQIAIRPYSQSLRSQARSDEQKS